MKRILFAVSGVFLVVPVLFYWLSLTATRYLADDYCFINIARENGVLGAVQYFYQTWSGTYSTVLTISVLGLLGHSFEIVIALLFVMLWIILLWDIFRRLMMARGLPFAGMSAAILSLLIAIALISGMPNRWQSLYWLNGRVAYFYPLIWTTIWFWLLLRIEKHTPITLALLGGICFIITGSAIAYALVMCALLGVGLAAAWQTRFRVGTAVSLVGAAAGLGLFLAAPGNAVRQERFPDPDVLQSIVNGVRVIGYPAITALRSSPAAFLALVFVPALYARLFDRGLGDKAALFLLFIFLIPIIASFLTFFAGFYGISTLVPYRVWVQPLYILLVTMPVLSYVIGAVTKKAEIRRTKWVEFVMAGLLITAGITNLSPAVDTWNVLTKWSAAWDERHTLLSRAGDEPVQVTSFHGIFGLSDLYVIPDDFIWTADCIKTYYGLEAIEVIGFYDDER